MARQIYTIPLSNIADKLKSNYNISALQNGNVNIYARYKGLNSNKESALTEEEMYALNYGISVTGQAVIHGGKEITKTISPWTISYVKPTTAKRLSDWIGYSPNATFPLREFTTTEVKIKPADREITLTWKIGDVPAAEVPIQCYLTEKPTKPYVGIFMSLPNATVIFAEDGHIGEDYSMLNSTISFKLPSDFAGQTAKCYVCICNQAIHKDNEEKAAIYGSSVSGLPTSVVVIPIPHTETNILLKGATWDDYFSSWDVTVGAFNNSTTSRKYIRIQITAQAVVSSTVSFEAYIYKPNGSVAYSSTNKSNTWGTSQSSYYIDIEVINAEYNNIVNGTSTYTFVIASSSNSLTHSDSGKVSARV